MKSVPSGNTTEPTLLRPPAKLRKDLPLPKLQLKKRDGEWWIIGLPPKAYSPSTTEYGPYRTKADAEEELRGSLQLYRDNPEILDPWYGYDWRVENLGPTGSAFCPWLPRSWHSGKIPEMYAAFYDARGRLREQFPAPPKAPPGKLAEKPKKPAAAPSKPKLVLKPKPAAAPPEKPKLVLKRKTPSTVEELFASYDD